MKRIGIFLGTEPSDGGVFHYTRSLLEALLSLPGGKFEIVAAYIRPSWLDYLRPYQINRLRLSAGTWGLRLAKAMMVARLPGATCRTLSPFINPIAPQLIAQNLDLWIFPAQDAVNYQIPVPGLSTIHDLMHRYEGRFAEVSRYGRRATRDHWFRNTVQWSTGILVDSDVGRQHVLESHGGNIRHKVYVLPYIAPPHKPKSAVTNEFESRYPLPPKFIFYPAQFWPHKNHINLISAVSTLLQECPDIHLVLCGSRKNGFQEIMRHIDNLGMNKHVTVTGYVPDADMSEFFQRARAMVMPTFFGPTNIPPMEAFALGCPVAMSGIYAMPEQGGEAALYFDPKSVLEIAQCVRRLWQDDSLCSALREKGFIRSRAWSKPQFEETVRKIIDTVLFGHASRCDEMAPLT